MSTPPGLRQLRPEPSPVFAGPLADVPEGWLISPCPGIWSVRHDCQGQDILISEGVEVLAVPPLVVPESVEVESWL